MPIESSEDQVNLEKRKDLFKETFEVYYNNHAESLIESVAKGLGYSLPENIGISKLKDAHIEFIKFYSSVLENYLRPLITKKSNSSPTDNKVDIFKILSASEYCVMGIKPLFITQNGETIDYSQNQLRAIENILNASFAFFFARKILQTWSGQHKITYKKIFDGPVGDNIFNYKESVIYRQDAMTIEQEHVNIIALSNYRSYQPILVNSTWWRMVGLCGYISFKVKVDFDTLNNED